MTDLMECLELLFVLMWNFNVTNPALVLPPLTAGFFQEELGVRDQLWVPSVCAGSEAGHLPASGKGQRLRGSLRGELRAWPRMLRSEEMLLQRLWSHLPGPQRPLQGWVNLRRSFLYVILAYVLVYQTGSPK